MKSRHHTNEHPLVRAYPMPAVNFGGDANVAHLIVVPKLGGIGLPGKVLSVEISQVTEDFTGDVSDAGASVGDGTTVGKYFASGILLLDETVDIGEVLELEDTGSAVDIEKARSSVTFTAIAGSTTETGICTPTPIIAWF